MKSTADKLHVTEFNIDGFLNLALDQYLLQKNNAEFNTKWLVAIDMSVASLTIDAIYEPVGKLDFSKLATYKAANTYTIVLDNLDNEKEEIKNIVLGFVKELADEYNKRLIGTRVQIPFPVLSESELDRFCQRVISSLHKALERLRNIQSPG